MSCPRKKPASTSADTGKVAGGKPATGRLCQAGLQNTRRVSGASPKRANPLDKKRFQAIKAKFIDAPCALASYAGPATCAVLLCGLAGGRPGRARAANRPPLTVIRERQASAFA